MSERSVWARVMLTAVGMCVSAWSGAAIAQPGLVQHIPADAVFAELPGITMREPEVPREGEGVDLWVKVGPSFSYDRVYVYYTLNGTDPVGSNGNPGNGSTFVLSSNAGQINFIRNQPSPFGGNDDWWKGTVPVSSGARTYGTTIRYKISAFDFNNTGNAEVFANGGAAFAYTNRLAWPGGGAGSPNPSIGYPPVYFWKEEAIFGNQYTAGMLDQNGTVYDFHFPTVGGVYGVGTKNEGYVDGLDTFPAGLPLGWRGQMHINQAMPGIRIDGVTYWLSNQNGAGYDSVAQQYIPTSNTVQTSQRLYGGGNNIGVVQYDFSPAGIAFPNDNSGNPQRHIYIKRMILTNQGSQPKTADIYWYVDPALNGGDTHDFMDIDTSRGAMFAFDNTFRVVTGTGTGFSSPNEYNPTTSGGYQKDKSLYLASAMKFTPTVGPSYRASEFARDTSLDNGQGWMGGRVVLPVGQSVTVDILMAGAADDFAGATGTYGFKLANVVDWFNSSSMAAVQSTTDTWWANWLAAGTTFNSPDAEFNKLFSRGLLATALHVDKVNGGVIAGFHNGAYPYVWPRDAVYAAVTLARTGHLDEAAGVYRWMKDVCFRDFEGWGRKGFWKQKYSTDGYVIWGAPQIDETAVFPWGVKFQDDMTADNALLNNYVDQVRDAVLSSTQTSTVDPGRLRVSFGLMYSNNVWEDSYDTFVYSNANVVRGLRDAGQIFSRLGLGAEATDANNRADSFKSALDARLDWDGENTDISALGISYPFEVYSPTDFRSARVVDRINGVRRKFNNAHPTAEPLVILNSGDEHKDLVNRYWGDTYWNGGPWFLSTLWYGLYYAQRQDFTPGKGDISNHKMRVDLLVDRLGPVGLGAEQIAYGTGPGASLMYPGQQDFKLQTAWPNAWESMSTFVDALMMFVDYKPDARNNKMAFEPKLPNSWNTLTVNGIRLNNRLINQNHNVDLTVTERSRGVEHRLTNRSGHAGLAVDTVVRIDTSRCLAGVGRNGLSIPFTLDPATGRVSVSTTLDSGASAVTSIVAGYCSADVDDGTGTGQPDGGLGIEDLLYFLSLYESGDIAADVDSGEAIGVPDGGVGIEDLLFYLGCYQNGCN